MKLHPLVVRVRRSRRLSNHQLEHLSRRDLVAYCDRLLTQEAAVEVLRSCYEPSHSGTGRKAT